MEKAISPIPREHRQRFEAFTDRLIERGIAPSRAAQLAVEALKIPHVEPAEPRQDEERVRVHRLGR